MAQRRSIAWSELKVGLLVILSFIALAVAIVRVGGPTSLFGDEITLTAGFPSANGLKPGAEVQVDGILVGNVDSVSLNRDASMCGRVAVVMSIDQTYSDNIRTDSTIGIDTIGLLGDKNIQIAGGTADGVPIGDGGTLCGDEVGDIRRIIQGTDDVVANFNILSDKLVSILDAVDRGEGTLGKLLATSEIHDNLNATVLEMESLISDIRTGPGTAGRLISDDEMYRRFNSVLAGMEDVVGKVSHGDGTAAKFLNDPELYNKFDQLLTRTAGVIDSIDRGEGTLGKFVKDDALYNDFRTTMARFERLIDTVENGQGTAGRLLQDPTLFNTMNQAASEVQKLLYDLRQDPRKYLTINFKLF